VAQFVENLNRSLIPRWRPFAVTATVGELGPTKGGSGSTSLTYSDFEEKVQDWRDNRSVSFACQLIDAAIVHRRFEEA
jgi:hypothetical protein